MLAFREIASWLTKNRPPQRCLALALAGSIMAITSVTPWLKDPFGKVYSAWELPIDIGWQVRLTLLNYGMLCLCCTLYAFLVAYANWPALVRRWTPSYYPFIEKSLAPRYRRAGLFCLIPLGLFLLQYLLFDIQDINLLAQHKIQILLIQQHLGYKLAAQRIPITAFTLDPVSFSGRFAVLINQASLCTLLPCLSTCIGYSFQHALPSSHTALKTRHGYIWWSKVALFTLAGLILSSRVPAASLCEQAARVVLASGDYSRATKWLDIAHFLQPEIDQFPDYHVERGQIQYFVHHNEQDDDSRAYLASVDYQQTNYWSAYQHLLAVWKSHPHTSWVLNEIDLILERFAESKRPLGNPSDSLSLAIKEDDRSLPELQLLIKIDPTNMYAHYVIGRIEYELHAYIDCTSHMIQVNQISTNNDIQSSAYTYIGLSEAGLNDYIDSRTFLLKAVALDPHYYNNTARENLSGLH